MTWLPESWGITAAFNQANNIDSFTSEGLASGVYQGLKPTDLCGWTYSYHNAFTGWGTTFVPFEMGGATGQDVITIARTQPLGPTVSKVDDKTGCVGPGDTITYTITVDPAGRNHQGVRVVDTLPAGVSYDALVSWSPPTIDPNYDATAHTYTWELGALAATADPVVLTLTVTVNDLSDPTGELVNEVLAESDLGRTVAWERTAVCCRDTGRILYVDAAATGANMGASWADAYTDLQRAFERVRESECAVIDEIRMARGEYGPGEKVGDSFAIPPGVSIYGGYRGGAIDPNDRDPKRYRTILSGRINEFRRSETVVTMGDNTLLDGVTVRDASDAGQGILAEGVTYTLSNCVIENNGQYGIRGIGCHATIRWCTIRNNTWHGIFQDGTGNIITIENCTIQRNNRYGIYLDGSVVSIKNSTIVKNGSDDIQYYGIRLINPQVIPALHNNTIAYNRNAGIAYIDNDPNYANKPDIQNCILWYNNNGGEQQAGYKVPTHYSCVYDPNDPNGVSTTLDTNGNFSHKPDFAYTNEPNNVHLAANSYCINKGNPNLTYADANDIDGEYRIMGTFVDVGADEVNPECDDVYHPLDWNADGVVNLLEFSEFSHAWLTCDPNRPGGTSGYDPNDFRHWNLRCDLDQDYDVDLADLVIFAEDNPQNWLWVACWRLDMQPEELQQMTSMVPDGGVLTQSLSASSASIESTTVVPDKSAREQLIDLEDTIQFLEKLWLDDPSVRQEIDPDEWQQFMDKVYDGFNELINSKTLDLSEESQ